MSPWREVTGGAAEEPGGVELDRGNGGGVGGGAWVWVRRAGVLAGVGTLCKEHAITSLAVCAAWDVIRHRKHVRRCVCAKPSSHATVLQVRSAFSFFYFSTISVLCLPSFRMYAGPQLHFFFVLFVSIFSYRLLLPFLYLCLKFNASSLFSSSLFFLLVQGNYHF